MIIDVHAHVFLFPKIHPSRNATTFMSAEDQITVMDRLGVDMAVILPLNNAECPAEPQSVGEVLAICERYPGRFIPFCNVDPRLPRDPEKIKVEEFEFLLGQYKALGCKGIGEVTARIRWTDYPMLCMLEAAEKLGLIITLHTITEDVNSYGVIDDIDLPGLETVLRRFPDLRFFGHSPGFWSEISGDVDVDTKNGYPKTPVAPGGTLQRLFREYPGLHGDLSAGSGLNALMRDPEHAYEFIDEFQDRLLLGLDFCSVKNDMQHVQWLTSIRDEKHISDEAYQKIMWKNANRLLRLGLEA
ncbi:MAG TPA: amidohydrolase family protein [Candidatus Hydrogenedentes bacterium]|nr:amidohydrolase family protein [Candidatus Hydrogenedentota bacterium]HPG67182.1 amidohydrolase family protein [Candidatus Hydrogenedentota bacterium]